MSADRQRPTPFRRRQFVAPHRRRSLFYRLARPFAAALLAVGVPAAVAFWILTSPVFALGELVVRGTERVPEAWVRKTLRPLHGRHLLWLPLTEVEERLLEHRWIRGVVARKELPQRLAIEVVERQPAALLRGDDDQLSYVDDEGYVIAPFEPALGGADLALLSGVERPAVEVPEALALVSRWRQHRPQWADGLSEIVRLGADDYRVFTAELPFPVRMSADGAERGLDRLVALLPAISARFPEIAEIDLRFSYQMVVKPAAWPRSLEG